MDASGRGRCAARRGRAAVPARPRSRRGARRRGVALSRVVAAPAGRARRRPAAVSSSDLQDSPLAASRGRRSCCASSACSAATLLARARRCGRAGWARPAAVGVALAAVGGGAAARDRCWRAALALWDPATRPAAHRARSSAPRTAAVSRSSRPLHALWARIGRATSG